MRAKRAENFDLLTFAPPPLPIRKTDRRPCLYTSLYWQDTKIERNLRICERAKRANLNFLTFSQSNTVISFIILLVLQILSLSLKLNICIHKNNQCTFLVIYHLWYDASSVASFLVLGGGGGARPRNVPTKNICTYIARASEANERLRNIYFHDSKYIFIVIYNAVSFNYLWYGTINDTILTKH